MRDKREKGWFWAENELIDREDLKPIERLLYLVLARHSNNETSESFPSLDTLCKKTGIKDKRTIVSYIKSLEEFELITVIRKTGVSNRYFLNNADTKKPVTKNDTSDKNCMLPVTKNDTRPVTKNDTLTIPNKKTKEKDLNISFEEFWNLYDKKLDSKKCFDKWNKLKNKDREIIMQHIPLYKSTVSEKKFLKNPMTYLNSQMWLDMEENCVIGIELKEISNAEILRKAGIQI